MEVSYNSEVAMTVSSNLAHSYELLLLEYFNDQFEFLSGALNFLRKGNTFTERGLVVLLWLSRGYDLVSNIYYSQTPATIGHPRPPCSN
jgi:hypothetical protein